MKTIKTEHANRISTYLIYFIFVLLGLGLGMTYLVYHTVEALHGDAAAINNMGIIRGSIQRATKLRLAGDPEASAEVVHTIDTLMASFIGNKKTGEERRGGVNGAQDLVFLNTNWQELKSLFDEYETHPDDRIKEKIVMTSEVCWREADAAVLTAQISTENKVAGIKIIYFFLGLNVVNLFLAVWFVYAKVRRKLEVQASYDHLTSLLNRYSYESEIICEIDRSLRYERHVSLIILDIDHFKVINDTYGHKTGDVVLRDLAGVISGNIRNSDSVFRIGGEEFAVIVPETDMHEAWHLAEKLRRKVASHDFPEVGIITISSGVAEMEKDDDAGTLFKKADEALYMAKDKGRNRVEKYAGTGEGAT